MKSLSPVCRVHGQKRICPQPLLIALLHDLRLQRCLIHLPKHGVGIELAAAVGVAAAFGDIFRRPVKDLKALAAQRLIRLQEPRAVKSSVVEASGLNGRISSDLRLLLGGKLLVHMGVEEPDRTVQARPAQCLFRQPRPLRCVHDRFGKTVF